MKTAALYKMKKEIDYSIMDFYLNEPYGKDLRPLKLHSEQKHDKKLTTLNKRLGRYFHMTDEHVGKQIIDEYNYKYKTEDRFLLEAEDMARLLRYYKQNKEPMLSKY